MDDALRAEFRRLMKNRRDASMQRGALGGHPNEGVTLWPYCDDIELDVIKRDWFEAYEALITMEPEIAYAPGLRFVITTQPTRLRATAPNRRSTNPSFMLSINCYAVSWDAKALVWLRCTRAVAQRPRRQDSHDVEVRIVHEIDGGRVVGKVV